VKIEEGEHFHYGRERTERRNFGEICSRVIWGKVGDQKICDPRDAMREGRPFIITWFADRGDSASYEVTKRRKSGGEGHRLLL